jgi:xanthine/CO dehydrogenase XdhC/CoxF family maturation factor
VHLGIPALLEFFRTHRSEDSLVLATIVETEGSTYRKPGAMMLISREGAYEGLISGGCLEGDLLLHAAKVFETGEASFVTYDMHADDELVWGLGLGCDGVIHLMLQRLQKVNDFGFFEQLDASHLAGHDGVLTLVVKSGEPLPCGAFGFLDSSDISVGEIMLAQYLRDFCSPWPTWRTRRETLDAGAGTLSIIKINMPARTRVLICGAGPDAVPVARMFSELDWQVEVADHREAFTREERFPAGCQVTLTRPERLGETVNLDGLDAVVIMSHHLENDCEYLESVAGLDIPYIGVLGPKARRERLCEMAGCSDRKVYGPVGLDIGAELPAAIALSLVSEIHAVLNHREGLPLTYRSDGRLS